MYAEALFFCRRCKSFILRRNGSCVCRSRRSDICLQCYVAISALVLSEAEVAFAVRAGAIVVTQCDVAAICIGALYRIFYCPAGGVYLLCCIKKFVILHGRCARILKEWGKQTQRGGENLFANARFGYGNALLPHIEKVALDGAEIGRAHV